MTSTAIRLQDEPQQEGRHPSRYETQYHTCELRDEEGEQAPEQRTGALKSMAQHDAGQSPDDDPNDHIQKRGRLLAGTSGT
jgi:hypothetical protein